MANREIGQIYQGYHKVDGAGVKLQSFFTQDDVYDFDPFLMLDIFGSDNYEDYILGFPMHPHRGIETVTYLLEGEFIHKDSLGNSGVLSGGELQWMTSGSGILHEEMPQKSDYLEGFQFWINMPKKDKMAPPEYLSITADKVKEIPVEKGLVKLIAGEFNGEKALVNPKYVQAGMMDISLESGAKLSVNVKQDDTVWVCIFRGSASFDATNAVAKAKSVVLFKHGDTVEISAGEDGVRLMLLTGTPLGEPIAWAGPVVMNTNEELHQAFAELRNGTFIK